MIFTATKINFNHFKITLKHDFSHNKLQLMIYVSINDIDIWLKEIDSCQNEFSSTAIGIILLPKDQYSIPHPKGKKKKVAHVIILSK